MQLVNERGERRAHVDFGRLRDLWFMWSVCNLECRHCYVASSPRNQSLELLSLEEIRGLLVEGASLGMEHVYFTGGEPFAHRDILAILTAAREYAPITVLTNGTGPIRRHLDDLAALRAGLTLRVSLDHFERDRHDAIRGRGAFDATVETVRALARHGFVPVVTVTPIVFEGTPLTVEEVEAAFLRLFSDCRIELKLLPTNLALGAEVRRTGRVGSVPFLTERQMAGANPNDFQCHTSRCVQKIDGRIRVYPCPIIYRDPEFELGATLRESLQRVYLAHHGCTNFCFKFRGKCGDERPVTAAAARRGM